MARLLTAALVLLALAPAGAEAANAILYVDMAASRALGDRGITPDATAPSDENLDANGRPIVIMPVGRAGGKVQLEGGFLFSRSGKKRTEFRSLRVDGKRITGSWRGKRYRILKLRGVKRTGTAITHKAAVLTGRAARLLSRRFDDSVFKPGMRFFLSGRIPL